MFTLTDITESAPALTARERGRADTLRSLIAQGKGGSPIADRSRAYLAEVNPALLASIEG